MPGWIRARDAASASIATPPALSFCAGGSSKSEPKKKSASRDPKQTTLKSHFAKTAVKDKARASQSWIPSLYNGKSSITEASQGSSTGKDSGSPNEVINRILKRRNEANNGGQQKKQRTDEKSPAPSFNLLSVFGQPPQSSLSLQPRTPPRRKAKVTALTRDKPAPAISPSKRKTLVIDSARDVAIQQHRQWQRSSSPLQAIDNVVGQRKIISTPRASTGLTPSTLRHGYSMIAFDDELGPETEPTQHDGMGSGTTQDDEGSDEQELPSSPSEERQERAGTTPKLPYTRSPRSNKRIYALETQPDDISPLQKYQTLRAYKAPLDGSDVETEKKRSLLDDSEPLSSPPPSSPEAKGMRGQKEDEQLRSSPTAAGGSFNIIDESRRQAAAETYVSEDEEEEEVEERRGCGDETFKLPSSEDDVITPIRPFEIKNKLRSNTKSPVKQTAIPTVAEAQDSGSETQSLPWDDEDDDALVPEISKRVSQRVNASWADVSKVWQKVDLDQGGEESRPTGQDQRQASLHSFGFETTHRPKEKKPVEVNRDIDFDDDEGVESETEDDDDATQVLAWSDEDDERGQSGSPALSMVPSEGDLDSQIRLFLDAV